MPCGGIWAPEPGSHWLAHTCWVCGETGCELFCDEWDTTLHVRCLGKFLETEEGKCMLAHGHGINVPEQGAEFMVPEKGITVPWPPQKHGWLREGWSERES